MVVTYVTWHFITLIWPWQVEGTLASLSLSLYFCHRLGLFSGTFLILRSSTLMPSHSAFHPLPLSSWPMSNSFTKFSVIFSDPCRRLATHRSLNSSHFPLWSLGGFSPMTIFIFLKPSVAGWVQGNSSEMEPGKCSQGHSLGEVKEAHRAEGQVPRGAVLTKASADSKWNPAELSQREVKGLGLCNQKGHQTVAEACCPGEEHDLE